LCGEGLDMARIHRLIPAVLIAALAAQLAIAGPAAAAPPAPDAVVATNTMNSVTLSWTAPVPRPSYFRVYEGSAIVARNTTTRVTINGLGLGSTHTYRVTAVAADGTESAPSAPVTRWVWIYGMRQDCQPRPPQNLRILDLTGTAVSLAWDEVDPAARVTVSGAGQEFSVDTSPVRLGGLTPGTTETITVSRLNCMGQPYASTIDVATPAGPAAVPGQPGDLSVSASTDTTLRLTWTAPVTGAPVGSYAVYRGATRLATTRNSSVRLTGLWRSNRYPLTVAAIGADGGESVHSASATGFTAACDPQAPRPEAVTATAVSASSIALRWVSRTEAISYTVLEGNTVVASVLVPSAMITGLRSRSQHRYRVVADLPGGCGTTPASPQTSATTLAGPAARPGTPTGFQPLALPPVMDPYGTVAMRWIAPAGAGPFTYRVYEGATVIGSTAQTAFTTRLPPATGHRLTVVAVDAAGNESPQSDPIGVTASYVLAP
jgi:fibronectin type 3 domain-containing protein